MYELKDVKNTIIQGDSFEKLKELPSQSVDCIVTSPPYYKLRNYVSSGQIGQEPTVNQYIDNLSAIFTECQRVLKDSGTCWVVIGDTYNSKSGGMEDLVRYGENVKQSGKIKYKFEGVKQKQKLQEGIKKQSLMLVPMRFGIRMTDDGWVIRNTIIWHKCLSKNTNLFVFKDGKYQFLTIEELANSFSDDIRVPTQDMKGNTIWIKIKNINYNGKQQTFKITTKSGNEIICTDNHIFPTRKSLTTSNNYRKISLNRCDELNINIDKLYVNEKLDINLPDGNDEDYTKGYFVGFYMAEGSFIKTELKPYKENKLSEYARKRWVNIQRGIKPVGIQLSCGLKDVEMGYIENFITIGKFKQYIYGNSLHIRSRDKNLLELVLNFINGNNAKEKYFTNNIFNQNTQFLKGIIDGFLSGDGHFDKKNSRWKIGITNNYKLKNQINLICRILGYDFRFENERFTKIGNKKYPTLYFSIRKISTRLKTGCKLDAIDKIEVSEIEDVYDIEVHPIYTSFCGKGKTEKETLEKKKSKYNHLYFLANGVWTHNSNCMPSSIKTRFTVDFEYVFFMTKNSDYYFNTQYEPMKIATLQRSQRNIGYKKQATGNYAINDKSCKNYYNNLSNKVIKTGIKFGGNKLAGGDNPTYSGNEWIVHPDFKRIMRTVWTISTENYSGKHYACVDQDTEILTINGWKKYNEVNYKQHELIATFNMNKEIIEYQKIDYMKIYNNCDTMYHIGGNRNLDIMVTDNHRNVIRKLIKNKGYVGKDQIKLTSELVSGDKIRVMAPINNYPENNGVGKNFAELLGWIISEGSYNIKYKYITIYQNEGEKSDRIIYLLNKLEIPYTKTSRLKKNSSKISNMFYLKKSPLVEWCIDNVKNKELNKFLVSLPLDELQCLFNGLINGDGHIRKNDGRISLIQYSSKTRDWFQIMALRLGYNSTNDNERIVYLNKKTHISIRNSHGKNIQKINYNGIVWCPKTKNGTWIARRNGKIFITGNTYPKQLVQRCIDAGSPKEVCNKCGHIRTEILTHIHEHEVIPLDEQSGTIKISNKPYAVSERDGWVAFRKLPKKKVLTNFLNEKRKEAGYTIDQLEQEVFKSQAPHHWFSAESYPTIADWKQLKEVLKIPDNNEFEIQMTKEYFKSAKKMNFAYTVSGKTDCGCNAGFSGGIVLDPFMGAATTAIVALKNNMNFIGIELNPEYIKQSWERIEKEVDKKIPSQQKEIQDFFNF